MTKFEKWLNIAIGFICCVFGMVYAVLSFSGTIKANNLIEGTLWVYFAYINASTMARLNN